MARPLAKGLVLLVFVTSGCSTLFPEFFGGPAPDAATDGAEGDGGGGPLLQGQLCALADLRDFASCQTGIGAGFRVTVEETRDQTTADASGRFSLPLQHALDVATLAAIDPSGRFTPTVTAVRLTSPSAAGLAIPLVSAAALAQAAASNGVALDSSRGALLAWAVSRTGAPIANARALAGGGSSLFTDGDGPDQLVPSQTTGARGLVALFAVAAPSLTIQVTPPPQSGLRADQFTLPARAGAATVTTLVLLP